MPGSLNDSYPNLAAALTAAAEPSPAASAPAAAVIATAGGASAWAAFAKGNGRAEVLARIFEELVVPGLGASMGWQTWRTLFGAFGPDSCAYDTRQSMPPACALPPCGWASANLDALAVPAAALSGIFPNLSGAAAAEEMMPPVAAWRSCDDHSKWGVALPLCCSTGSGARNSSGSGGSCEAPPAPWVCFCDNNRQGKAAGAAPLAAPVGGRPTVCGAPCLSPSLLLACACLGAEPSRASLLSPALPGQGWQQQAGLRGRSASHALPAPHAATHWWQHFRPCASRTAGSGPSCIVAAHAPALSRSRCGAPWLLWSQR